jgi:hypothetical protein
VGAAWSWLDSNVWQPLDTFFNVTVPGALGAVAGAFSSAWASVTGTVGAAWSWMLTNVFIPIGQMFTETIPGAIGTVLGFFQSIPGAIGGALGGLFSKITGAFGDIPGWVNINVIQPMVAFFQAVPGNIYSAISSGVSGAVNIAKGIINGVIGLMNDAIDFYDSHRPSVFGISLLPAIGDIPTLHDGGIVPGPAGADVPAILQAGELVISRNDVGNLTAAAGGTSQPSRILKINQTIQAFDPSSAAIEMGQRMDYAAKTRGF